MWSFDFGVNCPFKSHLIQNLCFDYKLAGSQLSSDSNLSSVFTCLFFCLMLKDQWGHVEEIELVNDGSGLGFGIVGGKTMGVVVRTLVPNSVADKVSECFQTSWSILNCCS